MSAKPTIPVPIWLPNLRYARVRVLPCWSKALADAGPIRGRSAVIFTGSPRLAHMVCTLSGA